jgi:hypothetical protein
MTRRVFYAFLSAFGMLAASAFATPTTAAAQSARACDAWARDYARHASRQGQVLGRGAVGSAMGAGIGAAFGNAGRGAAIGGGVGLISGGARRQQTFDMIYQAAFRDCMAGRVRW